MFYVGRLSVDSAEELTIWLNKILNYEKNPTFGQWPTKALLAANGQNQNGNYGVDPQFPSKYAFAVNSITTYGGYTDAPSFNGWSSNMQEIQELLTKMQLMLSMMKLDMYYIGDMEEYKLGSGLGWI